MAKTFQGVYLTCVLSEIFFMLHPKGRAENKNISLESISCVIRHIPWASQASFSQTHPALFCFKISERF